jgi:hypothetical protein
MQDNNEIYQFMKANSLTDKDEKTFLNEYSNPQKAKELYSFFQANKLTDKDETSFYDTYLKKKEPSQSSATKLPLPNQPINPLQQGANIVGGGVISDISAKAPKGSIKEAALADKKNNESYLGALWNNAVGSAARLAGGAVRATYQFSGNPVVQMERELLDKAGKAMGKNLLAAREKEISDVAKGVVEKGRTSASSKEYERKIAEGFDVTDGLGFSDLKGAVAMIPQFVSDMGLAAATGGGSFAIQGYDDALSMVDEMPEGSNISEGTRVAFGLGGAAVVGLLEKLGFDNLIKSPSAKKYVTAKILKEATDELVKKGVKVTADQFEKTVVDKASKLTRKELTKIVASRAAKSAAVEGGTEAVQEGGMDLLKLAANKIEGKEIFDEEEMKDTAAKRYLNSLAAGGILGGLGSSVIARVQNTEKAIKSKLSEAKTIEDIDGIVAEINDNVVDGTMTQEEADNVLPIVQNFVEVSQKVPETLNGKNKVQAVDLINEREKLGEQLKDIEAQKAVIDPSFHPLYDGDAEQIQERVNEINKELGELAKPENNVEEAIVEEEIEQPKVKGTEPEISQPIELSPELPIEEGVEIVEAKRVEGEPETKEGVKVVTLSGMVEEDRVKAVEERKKKTTLNEKETTHNDLIDLASRADKARGNEKTNLQGQIRQRVRELNEKAGQELYRYDGVSVRAKSKSKTKGERYLKIKGTTRDISGRAIKDDAVLLFDRTPEFVQKYEELAESPNITALQVDSGNGVTMTADQIESALQDIADGIPSVQADNLLNALEEGFNNGYFDLRGEAIGQKRIQAPIEDFIGVQGEEVGQPMNEEEAIKWLNEIAELPQEEQIEIDNIILEYEQQPKQIDIIGKVQESKSESKDGSPTSPKPNKEGKGNGKPKAEVNKQPIGEAEGEDVKKVDSKKQELINKVLALKIDLSKLSDGGLQSNPLGLPIAVWNSSMDIIAEVIRQGGNIADAVKRGLNYIQKNHRGKWEKQKFNDEVLKELGLRGITVNGQDLIVKDDAKTNREFAETVNGFYSDIEQSILDVNKGTVTAKEWLGVIGNGDEATWTGVKAWLESKKPNEVVSKKELQQWMKDNRIEIVEVVKGGGRSEKEIIKDIEKEGYTLEGSLGEEGYLVLDKNEEIVWYDDMPDNIKKLYDELATVTIQDASDTKFSQYQLEGEKENYKEVLVTMPRRNLTKPKDAKYNELIEQQKRLEKEYEEYDELSYSRDEKIATEATRNREVLSNKLYDVQAELNDYTQNKIENTKFQSSHFDEPNILVHLRMNTRQDSEGNKVLFLEEVQSDWGQKGKKEGFKDESVKDKLFDIYAKQGVISDKKIGTKFGSKEREELDKEYKKLQEEEQLILSKNGKINAAPFVTDTNSWTKLGLKVALKEAVKQGADKLSWTTGEQQNERYDLSKSVDSIQYAKVGDDKYLVSVTDKNNNEILYNTSISLKEIESTLGKDIAEKIKKGEDKEQPSIQRSVSDFKSLPTIKGEGLQVGGKGMKGFYGSPKEGSLGIVGNVAKSLFKQEPKTVEIKSLKPIPPNTSVADIWEAGGMEEFKKKNGTSSTQHSIDITPELKAEAESGLPLFKDIKGRGKEIADLLRKGKIKIGGLQSNIAGIPIALYNATIDTIALALENGATLAEAVYKAIKKHNLKKQKDFNQSEYIKALEASTGESLLDAVEAQLKGEQEKKSIKDKQLEEGREVALAHADTELKRAELGLDGRTLREVKKDEQLEAEADEAIKNGYNVKGLMKRILGGDLPTDTEHIILVKYAAGLESKLEGLNPSSKEFADVFNEINEVYKASEKGGSELGAAFRARQKRAFKQDSLGEMLVREAEINMVDELTPAQREEVVKEYEAIKKAKEEWEKKYNELVEKQNQKDAEEEVAKVKKATTPKKKDFAKERQSIKDSIKEKWAKAANDGTLMAIPVPYAKQLAAISPDVAKLMKSYVEEGITELSDIVKNIHNDIKDYVEGVTEKDVRDIIGGVYNEKRTRTELAIAVNDLRQEQKLLLKLEALQNGEVPQTETKKREQNKKLKELRDKIKSIKQDDIDAAREELNKQKLADKEAKRLEKEANKKSPEQIVLDNVKKRITKQIQELEEKLAKGDYSKEAKKEPIKLDEEALALKDKLIKLKQEREIRILQQEYANRTKGQKAKDLALEIVNVPRTLMASMDFSAPLRQGIVASVANPKEAGFAFVEMFRQAMSQKRFDRWFYDLRESDVYPVMEEAGLYIADPHDPKLSAKEEMFMNNLAEKIPLIGKMVKGSERAYVSYLNKMRADLFVKGMMAFEADGKTVKNSPELYKSLASFINNSTGRGKMTKVLEDSAPILNSMFFSPRLMASRINMLNPAYYHSLSPEIQKMAMKDMGAFIGFGLSVLALAALAGADVEEDPRSPNFGKIKVGDTTYDIWGGFQQYVVELTQFIRGETKSATTGQIRKLDGKTFPFKSRGDDVEAFIRGKAAPVPAAIMNLLYGKKVTGQRTNKETEAVGLLSPLMVKDAVEAFKKDGILGSLAVGVPAAFGIGVQTISALPDNVDEKNPVWKFVRAKKQRIPEPDTEMMKVGEQDRMMEEDEAEKFLELRMKKVEKGLKILLEQGKYIVENEKAVIKKGYDLTPEQLEKEISRISRKATSDAKEELFGEKTKSDKQRKAESKAREKNEKIESKVKE